MVRRLLVGVNGQSWLRYRQEVQVNQWVMVFLVGIVGGHWRAHNADTPSAINGTQALD
jgi:hypothetical protein